MELQPKPFVGPLLQRLLNGDWAAVEEMAEEIRKDEEIIREVSAMLGNLRARAQSVLTAEDVKRDAEVIQGAKVKMGALRITHKTEMRREKQE